MKYCGFISQWDYRLKQTLNEEMKCDRDVDARQGAWGETWPQEGSQH